MPYIIYYAKASRHHPPSIFMTLKAFFFDLDGTLIDSEPIWIEAIVDALHARQVQTTFDDIKSFEVGRAWPEIFAIIKQRWPDAYSDIIEMQTYTTAYYEKTIRTRDIAVHPSIELLKRMSRNGFKTAIVTGSVKSRVLQTVSDYALQPFVNDVITSEDYAHGKPSPDCYLLAAKRVDVSPADCCAFEDAASGVLAAKDAGMKCVGLARSTELKKQLEGIADIVLETLADFTPTML